jgi:hypothetical protein
MASYRLALAYALKNERNLAARYYGYTIVLGGSVSSLARAKLQQLVGGSSEEIERVVNTAREEVRRRIEARRLPTKGPAH